MKGKKCSKCGRVLPVEMFNRDKKKKDGLRYTCKDCDREMRRRYYEENLEKERERRRRYREQNPEKILEFSRRWREKNREKDRERKRRYRKENPDKERDRKRRWIKNNWEKERARCIIKNLSIQTGIPKEELPEDFVKLKLLHVQLKRELREKTQ